MLNEEAARALTDLSQAEVADSAGVSIPTLKRAEAGGPIKVADTTIAAIAKALEKAKRRASSSSLRTAAALECG